MRIPLADTVAAPDTDDTPAALSSALPDAVAAPEMAESPGRRAVPVELDEPPAEIELLATRRAVATDVCVPAADTDAAPVAVSVALALTVLEPLESTPANWNDTVSTSAIVAAPDTEAVTSSNKPIDADTAILAAPETEAVTSKSEVPGDEKGACENEEDANIYLVQRIRPVVDRCVACWLFI
tara:strand:- start:1371 stop:1919 length:549 start_codon:yes stop_codon:yes gene_type:complete